MIENIILSSMLNFYQVKDFPYSKKEEKKEIKIERYGLREEEVLVNPSFYFLEKINFRDLKKESKENNLNKMKGGRYGRFN